MTTLRAQGVSSPAARDQKKSTENRESHLSTLLHIFPSSPPLLRTTFPPFPRPLWDAPAHAERTRAALDSPKANAALAWSTPPSTWPERGNHGPPWFIARIAGQNQYNKLLGNLRITVRSFRIVITCMVKYLKLEDVIILSSLLY